MAYPKIWQKDDQKFRGRDKSIDDIMPTKSILREGSYHYYMTQNLPLLLASASPRRMQILTSLGLPFTIGVSAADEEAAQEQYHGPLDGLAQWLASHKALAMLAQPESANKLVITADTTVLLDDQ